jgi:hypothetical protein
MRRRRPPLALPAHAAALALLLAACGGPLGPVAGGRLRGEPAPPPSDWSYTRDVLLVQLETRPERPWSVTLGCIDYQGALYVGSPDPERDRWVAHVTRDPRVRLRVEGRIYELQARRVTDPAEWAAAGRLLYEKYDLRQEAGREPGWLFRLDPRQSADSKSRPTRSEPQASEGGPPPSQEADSNPRRDSREQPSAAGAEAEVVGHGQ